jgi:hypothetical protein
VIELAPVGSVVVLKEAAPLALSAPVPSVVAPLWKVTVPVGVVLPDAGATVAVRTTFCPGVIWTAEAVSVVVVATTVCVTFTVTAEETELASLLLPP